MAFDLDDFLAIPRLSGLLVSPDGRVAVHSAVPDAEGAKFVTRVVAVDPAGGARQLTTPRAGLAAVGWTPRGDLLLRDSRPDPAATPAGRQVAALWRLPAAGGEASFVAATPAGVGAVRVARDTGTTVLLSEVYPAAATLEEDRAKAEAREKVDTSALLFEGYPFRHWDHHLGPRAPRLFVVDPDGSLRDLTGAVGQALQEANWDITPDGSTIVTSWVTPTERGDADRYLVAIDVATGRRTTLWRESGFDQGDVVCSPNGRYLAVTRSRHADTPWDTRLWLHPRNGEWPRELAAGLNLFPENLAWTPDSAAVLFTADQRGRAPVFRVDIADPNATAIRLSDAGAFTDLRPAPAGRTVYALRSTVDRPPEVVALDPLRPDQRPTVVYAAEQPAPLPGRLEEVHTTAADGTELRAWLVLPEDASAATPAPLLLMVHGGPVASSKAWAWRWQPHVFAARGYAVLLPDPALSTGYGIEMLRRGWSHWGDTPYADVMALTDAALRRDDLDADRTAVSGGSYGGYLTNWIIGHTDRFRCAVSHAGRWNLATIRGSVDHVTRRELWWGEPNDAAEHYRDMSPSTYLERITTPTLVTHGERDYRVAVGEGLAVYTNLRRRGVRSALLYLPDENHWVLRPGNIRIWYSTFLAWLDHHLLGRPWNPPPAL